MQSKRKGWLAVSDKEEFGDYCLVVFLVLCCWVPFIVFVEMSGLLLGMTGQGLIITAVCLSMLMVVSVIIVNRLLLRK